MSGPISPRRRTPPRPYAKQRKWPSVTTCNVLDKHLDWAASKEAALFAVHHFSEWSDLSTDDAVERIRRHFRGVWDSRAAMGTLLHAVNEAWTWDEEPDLLALIERADVRLWEGREAEVVDEANRYVNGLEQFWLDWQPTTVASEEVVRQPTGEFCYVGQRDWVCDIGNQRWLLDLKSTARSEEDKGVYPDSWRLQLAAYRHAPEIVLYDSAGNEEGTQPNYPVDRTGVILLRGDDRYTFFEVQADRDEFEVFCQLRGLYRWVSSGSKRPAVHALSAPVREVAAA